MLYSCTGMVLVELHNVKLLDVRLMNVVGHMQTNQVIENFKRASDQMAAGANPQRHGSTRYASDADTLLRVLSHRIDPVASKFLKTKLKLPST